MENTEQISKTLFFLRERSYPVAAYKLNRVVDRKQNNFKGGPTGGRSTGVRAHLTAG